MRKNIKIPEQLLDAIAKRECVFFIGAGLSIEAGLPSGQKIAKELVNILARNGYSKGSQPLYKVAQDFENIRRRADLVKTIKNIITQKLNEVKKEPYELLSQIRPQPIDVITTNWDKCIEETYGRANINVILDDDSLAQYTPTKTNLLKIHGDLDHLMNATITENDYASFKQKHAGFYEKICTLFRECTVLFIGYSTEDWDFLEMYLKIENEIQGRRNPRYCVIPERTTEILSRLQNLGIIPIEATAGDFLSSLLAQLDEKVYEKHPSFPDPTLPGVIEKNPFVIFRAEDMSEELWKKELFREPKMYNIFADIISPGNTIIEGHRGSGKSMLLQYLSYPTQKLLDKSPNFVGVYIKLDLPLFATTRRRGENRDEWVNYFLSYFNLIVAEELIKMLDYCDSKSWISIDNIDRLLEKLKRLFPFLENERIDTLIDLADLIYEKRNLFACPPPRPLITVPPDLIKSLIVRVRRFVPEWKDLPFYILLDEYERLDENQQKVVNLLLASRGPTYHEKIYFKIATKSFLVVLEDIDGNSLDPIDDFTPVALDRFDMDEERKHKYYQKFIEEISNWRLQNVWDYKISIRELLPEEGDENKKGFKNKDYSGFENIVTLSSFLPRDFLELCKDMIFYAYPNLLREQKRDKLEPIAPNIQNTVIKIHGDNLFENLNRIMNEEERPLPRTRSENARRLIESWGKIFRIIFEGSKSKEDRTVSEFQIRNTSNLNKTAINALNDCTMRRALVIPLTRRVPQIRKNIPGDRYELHRLLCARFGLSLARRWPKEIDARWINQLLEAGNPEKIIKEIARYFMNSEKFPPAQLILSEYGEKNE